MKGGRGRNYAKRWFTVLNSLNEHIIKCCCDPGCQLGMFLDNLDLLASVFLSFTFYFGIC